MKEGGDKDERQFGGLCDSSSLSEKKKKKKDLLNSEFQLFTIRPKKKWYSTLF